MAITVEKRGLELNPWKVINKDEVIGKIEIPTVEEDEDGHTLKVGYRVVLTDGTNIDCWKIAPANGLEHFTHQHIIDCVEAHLKN